jgi:acyl dehydratase
VAIDRHKLLQWQFEPIQHSYTHKDVILYALGIGLGRDPLDRAQLKYVYERDLSTLPTFAVTLATLGMWVKNPETGITWQKLVHSAQTAQFLRPLPPAASVTAHAKISQLWDRGPEKGAVIVIEREIRDTDSRELYCTLEQTLMLRGDGGFGGEPPPPASVSLPEHAPDAIMQFATTPGQAILYRLSGDWNPLHIDPEVARSAGFSQPVLHGYCSYGIAGWAACQVAQRNPSELSALECRFTGPVTPGDELAFHWWNVGETEGVFQVRVGNRIVLDQGRARFRV